MCDCLRGFRARSVGPGSYIAEQEGNFLVDQVGERRPQHAALPPRARVVIASLEDNGHKLWLHKEGIVLLGVPIGPK